MRWLACTVIGLLVLGTRGIAAEEARQKREQEVGGILDCVFEPNSLTCLSNRMAREMDAIETQITGRSSKVSFGKIIEESGSLLADGVQAIFGPDDDEAGSDEASAEVEESRKKKLGKKKKKQLQKLLMIGMLIKTKVSLLLQLITTHFQFKFFVIAIASLLINAARFWLDLKKSHQPSKVIYYEHAQHQHHYDHVDDDHGIWGRSSDEAPQELAYNAYAPEK